MSEELAPGVQLMRGATELALDPELWTIKLRDGSELTVLAHGQLGKGSFLTNVGGPARVW